MAQSYASTYKTLVGWSVSINPKVKSLAKWLGPMGINLKSNAWMALAYQ